MKCVNIVTNFIILLTSFAAHAKEEALLTHLPRNNIEHVNTGDWAVACPAETTQETDFVQKYSLSKNALFVKKTFPANTDLSAIETNVCENPHKISLAYKIENLTFQFGYEIYYNSKQKLHFKHCTTKNYKDYKSAKDAIDSTKTTFNRGIFHAIQYVFSFSRTLTNAIGISSDKLFLNEDEMEFVWLYFLFKLRFNLTKKILEVTWHEIQKNSKWPTEDKNEDYSLGFEVYEGTNVDDLYNNQAKIFNNFKLPSKTCESTDQCLVKWSLIPLDQFNYGSPAPLKYSNITTIPIWKGRTEKILQKLDKYLYTLFRVLNDSDNTRGPINVHSGITGETQFFSKGSSRKSTLYLELEKKEIPVPLIIYKIVEYKLKNCPPETSSCWYSVIIVIHNDPFFKLSDKVCTHALDVTKEWGWEEITKDIEGNFDQIYACRNVKSVQKKLRMEVQEEAAGGLSLTKFVYTKRGDVADIKKQVDDGFRKFSEQGETFDPVRNKVVEY